MEVLSDPADVIFDRIRLAAVPRRLIATLLLAGRTLLLGGHGGGQSILDLTRAILLLAADTMFLRRRLVRERCTVLLFEFVAMGTSADRYIGEGKRGARLLVLSSDTTVDEHCLSSDEKLAQELSAGARRDPSGGSVVRAFNGTGRRSSVTGGGLHGALSGLCLKGHLGHGSRKSLGLLSSDLFDALFAGSTGVERNTIIGLRGVWLYGGLLLSI